MPLQILFTLLLLGLAGLVCLGAVIPAAAPLLSPLAGGLTFALEFLYRLVVSNEGMVAVAVAVLALGAVRGPLGRLLGRLPGRAAPASQAALDGFIALLILAGLAYLAAFAALANPGYLALVLAAGLGAGLLAWRRRPDRAGAGHHEPGLDSLPPALLLGWLALYLHLGLVQGHLTTPLVHGAAAAMAALSAGSPAAYRLVALLLLLLPMLPWLPRLWRGGALRGRRRTFSLAALALLLASALPGDQSPLAVGVLVAAGLGWAHAAAGLRPLGLAHPDPRRLLIRLSLTASLLLTATTAHYLAVAWRCPEAGDNHPALRRLSAEAGAFDLAVTADGAALLVSLREPRRVLRLDLKDGGERTWLDADALGQGTGHLFSWTEPENILPLGEGGKVLLLRAVSDDEDQNRVLLVGPDGQVIGPLPGVPPSGMSDMVSDGAGALYLSQEFEGNVYELDAATLSLRRTLEFDEVETNKVCPDPARGRLYSLGLWFDPYLRKIDLGSGQETARLDVGTLNWDMAVDPRTGLVFVPKFAGGEVLVIDPERMAVKASWPAGFGARTVDLDAERRLLLVGAMHAGTVSVFHLDSGLRLADLRLGGYIKGLTVDPRAHRAYVGCACGIFEIDLAKLLEP